MSTLIVDAFGSISPDPERVGSEPKEALHGPVLDRSILMGWSNSRFNGTSLLWNMEEAELTYHTDESTIGFVQVGLDIGPRVAGTLDPSTPIYVDAPYPTHHDLEGAEGHCMTPGWAAFPMPEVPANDPTIVIPPLVQCVHDALCWCGEIDLSALQMTGIDVSRTSRPHEFEFTSVLYWFGAPPTKPTVRAVVTVAADVWNTNMVADIVANLRGPRGRLFEIGPLTTAPPEYAAGPDMRSIEWGRGEPSQAIAVSLPEWTPSAVGWIIAKLFDTTLSHNPDMRNLSVRVTRSEG